MKRCPHEDVVHCPLYEAMHIAGGPSCDDGQLGDGGCAVARGASYSELIGRLMARHPGIVERNRWEEEAVRARAQRLRNMRVNGVH